jgi:hypothetical protein
MLRSRKHWAQSVGSDAFKVLAEFQETVVGMANVEHNKIFDSASRAEQFENFMTHLPADAQGNRERARFAEAAATTSSQGIPTTRADMVQGIIDDFVKTHPAGSCQGTYCYMPIKLLPMQGIMITSFRPSDEEYPIFPIGSTSFIDLDD